MNEVYLVEEWGRDGWFPQIAFANRSDAEAHAAKERELGNVVALQAITIW